MKKKMSLALVFALVLVSLSVMALAAGILFSPRVDAARLADQVLEEKYGITLKMHTYFTRQEEELPDGTIRVTYSGWDQLAWVLGTYTVDVKNGRAQVYWSHDGEETAGGYEATAWGAAQIAQMLTDSTETGDMSRFLPQACAIARHHNAAWQQPANLTEEEILAYFDKIETEKTAALEARVLTEEEMLSIGREAVISRYGMNDVQAAALELYVQPLADEPNAWYLMWNGAPCYEMQYFLTQNPGTFTDMDGTYAVLVNVQTGVVEEILYESGLGGEG